MNNEFVDSLEEMGVPSETANAIVDDLNSDESFWLAWYEENNMPQGLALVELHYYPTTKEFVEKLWADRNITFENTPESQSALVACELIIDGMLT